MHFHTSDTIDYLVALVAIFFSLIVTNNFRSRQTLPLPPGPPADPVIGHMRMLPTKDLHIYFQELAKVYGDVITIRIPRRTLIVLNSSKAATDLLNKRSAIYSDRASTHTNSMMGWIRNIVVLPYGPDFKKLRRLIYGYLNRIQCISYHPVQIREVQKLLKNLSSTPEDFIHHLSRYSTSIILAIVQGHEVMSDDDVYIKIAEDVNWALSAVSLPHINSVDLFPFLRHFPSWFPGAYPAAEAQGFRPVVDRLHLVPVQDVKRQLAEGTAIKSFLATHLDGLNRLGDAYQYSAADIEGTAALLYSAGADTSWASLLTFMLAMVLYPEVQAEAQGHIDEFIDNNHKIPSFEDRSSLEYLEHLLHEVHRWHSVAPLGTASFIHRDRDLVLMCIVYSIPHRCMEDDIYEGMHIPKGSIVIANTRSITRDERIYKSPEIFDPSRYSRGEPYPDAHFGFGRRKCPGRYLADATVWIAIVSILASFSISPILDDKGKLIQPAEEYDTGITSHPKPFKCSIVPRVRDKNVPP